MCRVLVVAFFLGLNFVIQAQSFLHNTGLEKYNYYLNNPAFIASDSMVKIDAIYYKQGLELDNSPKDISVAGNIPVKPLNSGFLINYNRNTFGNFITNTVGLGYTYMYAFNKLVFKVGISCSVNELSLKNEWQTPDGSDISNDPLIASSINDKKHYLENNYGIGLNYMRLTGGLSLVGHDIDLGDSTDFYESKLIYSFLSYKLEALSWLQLDPMISWHLEDKIELSLISTFYQNYRLGISYKFGERNDFLFGSKKESLFSLFAGVTILKHAYFNLVFNPDYYPLKSEDWGYMLLAQVGCRF